MHNSKKDTPPLETCSHPSAIEAQEASEVINLIEGTLTKRLVRHPAHGHSFYRTSLNYPKACCVCEQTVLIFGSPCRCLVCGILAHRSCVSRTYMNNTLPACTSFERSTRSKDDNILIEQKESLSVSQSGDCVDSESNENCPDDVSDIDEETHQNMSSTLNPGEEELETPPLFIERNELNVETEGLERVELTTHDDREEGQSISINDPNYRMKQVQRATSLGGSALVGTVVGGVISGVGIIAAPPILGVIAGSFVGKAAFAFTGATLGYRRQRLKQLELNLEIPTEDNIPTIWHECAIKIRKKSALTLCHVSYSGNDEFIQLAIEDCNLEEKINIFVSKTLFNQMTLPGIILQKLVILFKQRHCSKLSVNHMTQTDDSPHMNTVNNHGNAEEADDEYVEEEKEDEEKEEEEEEDDDDQLKNGVTTINEGKPLICETLVEEDKEEKTEESKEVGESRSPVLDCIGLLLEVVKAIFQYHPILGQEDQTVHIAINAVDRVVLGELYPVVFDHLISLHQKEESMLTTSSTKKLLKPSKSWNNLFISENAIRSLSQITMSRTAQEKLQCITRFVDCVSSDAFHSNMTRHNEDSTGGGGGGGTITRQANTLSADDLLPLLSKHVVVSHVPNLHAELAFVTLFCRDETLLIGRDGYALTSLCAAVAALDERVLESSAS